MKKKQQTNKNLQINFLFSILVILTMQQIEQLSVSDWKLQAASDCDASEGILLSDAVKSTTLHKILKAHVASNPKWYASQRANHSEWLKAVSRHVREHAKVLFANPKHDNTFRCRNCFCPLMIPSSNLAFELGFLWNSNDKDAAGDPQNIEMIVCEICLEMSRVHQHNRNIFDWAAALYCVHSKFRGVQNHSQDFRPIYRESILSFGREELAPVNCTIELTLLKAQFELQCGMVMYPKSGYEQQSLWKNQWRTAQVLQKKRQPYKAEVATSPMDEMNALPPLDPLWLTWDDKKQRQECIPWLNSKEYHFVFIPLSVEKHNSPLTCWTVVARNPLHPVSCNNFILTTQFLKHIEDLYGRPTVLKWLYFQSYHADQSIEVSEFISSRFRRHERSDPLIYPSGSWPTTLAEKRKVLDEYALQLNRNKKMKEQKKFLDEKLEEQRMACESADDGEDDSLLLEKMHTLLSVLATSQSGLMIMECLGLQFEYCCSGQRANGSFQSLEDGEAAYVMRTLLRKHCLVPMGKYSEDEERHLNIMILRLLQSFRDPHNLKQYQESVMERRIKHVRTTGKSANH